MSGDFLFDLTGNDICPFGRIFVQNVRFVYFDFILLIILDVMTIISATDARANFQDIVRRAEYGGERVLIQRHGKTVAAVISIDDLKRLEAMEDAIDSEILRRAVQENDGFTSLDSIIASRNDG